MSITREWHIICDDATFADCKADAKFPYIVTLARAVNALNFVNSAFAESHGKTDPAAQRNRLNSFFFGSAIIYEALKLIRSMTNSKLFHNDDLFGDGLHSLLRDPTAQRIEQAHLNPARHHAVFHFLPEKFADAIAKSTRMDSPFISSLGEQRGAVSYVYADLVAAEILVGDTSDNEEFFTILSDAMSKTRDLVISFIEFAEQFIAFYTEVRRFHGEES